MKKYLLVLPVVAGLMITGCGRENTGGQGGDSDRGGYQSGRESGGTPGRSMDTNSRSGSMTNQQPGGAGNQGSGTTGGGTDR